ncbi:MAG TPA: glycosyltransferase family 2 protein [Candidatus Methylomirabilis sp.]|nr:glycosyltransferase family 2 protein [Candidatus Methylomirabilis sp.]
MDLSIIIVSWNVREQLKNCLTRLGLSQTNFTYEVFVVDNGSHDGSAEMVAKDFPAVKLIANNGNVGFARANNQAFRESSGDYIFLLNPDTFVFESTIDNLLHWLNLNRRVGIGGCRLLDKLGADLPGQVRRYPGLFNQLAIILKLPYLFPRILRRYLCWNFDYYQPQAVETVRGSAMILRRSALAEVIPYDRWQRGELLDERFFVWFEDVDLCRTFKAADEEVWYTPAGRCFDLTGQSFAQLPRTQAQKYFRRSMLAYFKKWKPRWQFIILWLAWPVGIALTAVFTFLGFEKKDNT